MDKKEYLSAIYIKEASKTLPEKYRELFIDFMIIRFHQTPNYTHISYAMEWASRFNGDPRGAMDSTSRAVYDALLREQDDKVVDDPGEDKNPAL